MPDLHQHMIENSILLEAMLASPLMTLFGNILSFHETSHVLNLFILGGEKQLMDLLINIFKEMTP